MRPFDGPHVFPSRLAQIDLSRDVEGVVDEIGDEGMQPTGVRLEVRIAVDLQEVDLAGVTEEEVEAEELKAAGCCREGGARRGKAHLETRKWSMRVYNKFRNGTCTSDRGRAAEEMLKQLWGALVRAGRVCAREKRCRGNGGWKLGTFIAFTMPGMMVSSSSWPSPLDERRAANFDFDQTLSSPNLRCPELRVPALLANGRWGWRVWVGSRCPPRGAARTAALPSRRAAQSACAPVKVSHGAGLTCGAASAHTR